MGAISAEARGSRVLIVHAAGKVRSSTVGTLRQCGLIVDVASDGREALALASECPYGVVAADDQLPGFGGFELLSALRAQQEDATCILMTAGANIEAPDTAAYVPLVLTKPWDDRELVSLVQSGLERARARRQRRTATTQPAFQVLGQRVLVLEDNDFDAKVLQHALEQSVERDFRVVRAHSLGDACRLLRARDYTVVFADLSLPDASGLSAVTELQCVAPETPILVVTSADDEGQATEALRSGAQDYLVKGSYDASGVLRAIRYATERKRIQAQLTELAHYDSLTGLANRTLLKERKVKALARAARSRKHAALLWIDLDHFKAVNDTFGHDVGDQLLCEAGRRLTDSTRAEDTVARVGGDEFAVLLEELEQVDGARRVAQRILNAFATPLMIEGRVLPVTPSIGIAVFPEDATTTNDLQRHADTALYQAKRLGKNRYHFFGEGLRARVARRAELERKLLGALDAGQFWLAFQPEFDVNDDVVCGYEALLRWGVHHREALPAGEFLPILAETGDIIRVGSWVLGQVCASARGRAQDGLRFSLNVSARELTHPEFVNSVELAIRQHGIAGSQLEIEISESTLMNHALAAREKLPGIAELGVGIAVDGFGAGRCSMLELAALPITALKLHESFVARLDDARSCAALRAMLAAGAALGWTVVAQRVETARQRDTLQSLGCLRAQGRLWGAAAPLPWSA